jgi:protein-tyrosine phosphatase
MVDLHHHLLFGLDDGSPDLETSVDMARMAASDGITHVIATPHASANWIFDPDLIASRISTLRNSLILESVPLTIASGCDFHLSYDNVRDALANPRKYTLNSTEYLLIELPDFGLSPNLTETFYELRLAGMVPILTHPERNPTLQRDLNRLADWIRNGMLVQITTSSVLGRMGKTAERISHKLLANRWVNFLSTDAHNLQSRPPRMSEARDVIARKYSPAYADLLTLHNPLAVFDGRPLPEQPPPLHLYDDEENFDLPWWKRILGPSWRTGSEDK